MKNSLFALLIMAGLLASCGSKVSVSYNASYCKDHVVKIDDTMTLKSDDDKQFLKKTMAAGKHTLTIDAGKPVSFELEDDGILNIAHQEFVIFPIEFTNSSEDGRAGRRGYFGRPNALLIDSFVVGNKMIMEKYAPKWTRSRIEKNAKGIDGKNGYGTELVKTDSNLLVINKTWDIGISDEIPKSVKEYVPSTKKVATAYRKMVMDAKLFVLFATLSDDYKVQPLSAFEE